MNLGLASAAPQEGVLGLGGIAGAVVDEAGVVEEVAIARVEGEGLVHFFGGGFGLSGLVEGPGHGVVGVDAVAGGEVFFCPADGLDGVGLGVAVEAGDVVIVVSGAAGGGGEVFLRARSRSVASSGLFMMA